MSPTDARSAYRLQRIIENLADHDHTRAQLARAMHVSRPQSLAGYLDYLVDKRLAHVAAWTDPAPCNGHRQAIYRWGRGPNVKRPPARTHAELVRGYRARRRAKIMLALVE